MDRRRNLQIAAAIGAGLLLRLAFLHWFAHVEGDSLVYGDIATNILRHHAYALSDPKGMHETLIRLPGYPALAAACFAVWGVASYKAVLAVQIAFDLCTCALLAVLATRLAGPRAGMATLWVAALCPFTANYTVAPLTEIPANLCAALAFYALARWLAKKASWNAWLWVMGAACLAALSLRPDRGLLAVTVFAVIASVAWKQGFGLLQRVGPVLAFCGVVALLPVLWGIRNWRVFHVVQPLAPRSATDAGELIPDGFNRWYRTWGIDLQSTFDVYWPYDGTELDIDDLPDRAFDSEEQRAETQSIYDEYNVNAIPTRQLDARFGALARERERAHPLRTFVALPLARLVDMWLRPRTEMLPLPVDWWDFDEHRKRNCIAVAMGLLNLAYLVLAAWGLWQWRRRGWSGYRPLGYAMVLFVLLRSALLLTMDNAEPRYTLDCFPVVLLLAGMAVGEHIRELHRATEAGRG